MIRSSYVCGVFRCISEKTCPILLAVTFPLPACAVDGCRGFPTKNGIERRLHAATLDFFVKFSSPACSLDYNVPGLSVSSGRLKSRLHDAESKAGPEPRNLKEHPAAVAEKGIEKQTDSERARNASEGPAESKSSAQKGLLPEQPTERKDRKASISLSPASAREKESSLPTRRAEAPGLPPSGLAPSDEIRLLQEARESARAAAEASGSGRRPRAPSRKLLEASGKLMCDSIQWMTKEKKEEEARFKQEMKEQRKAAAAAGLKFGHRMEALALAPPVDARAAGDGAGTTGGGTASASAWTGINQAAATSVKWRKLTPAETLIAAGKQPSVDGAQLDVPASKVTMTAATGVMATGKGRQGERTSNAPAAAAVKAGLSERKRKAVASAGESTQNSRASKHNKQGRRSVEEGDSKGPSD